MELYQGWNENNQKKTKGKQIIIHCDIVMDIKYKIQKVIER